MGKEICQPPLDIPTPASGHHWRHTSHPREQIDTCENITFPKRRYSLFFKTKFKVSEVYGNTDAQLVVRFMHYLCNVALYLMNSPPVVQVCKLLGEYTHINNNSLCTTKKVTKNQKKTCTFNFRTCLLCSSLGLVIIENNTAKLRVQNNR